MADYVRSIPSKVISGVCHIYRWLLAGEKQLDWDVLKYSGCLPLEFRAKEGASADRWQKFMWDLTFERGRWR